jgi:hypothetical protein
MTTTFRGTTRRYQDYRTEVDALAERWGVPADLRAGVTEPMLYAAWRRRTPPAYLLASVIAYITAAQRG